jgi:hypothetical protein
MAASAGALVTVPHRERGDRSSDRVRPSARDREDDVLALHAADRAVARERESVLAETFVLRPQ